jgi:thioredoxin-like negative regulator of GroEL
LAKPAVDGLERDLAGQARLFRVERSTDLARELAGRYGLRQLPSLLAFDAGGEMVLVQQGALDLDVVRAAVVTWEK